MDPIANTGNIQISLSEISPPVRAILGDQQTADRILAIAEENKLSGPPVRLLARSVLLLFAKRVSPDHYLYLLQNELKVPPKKALDLACFIGHAFIIPHPEIFPEGQKVYQAWLKQRGGKMPNSKASVGQPARPIPTTSDIRRPVKRVVPPATPVKPTASRPEAAEGSPPVKEEKPTIEQFQLRTVDDLINVLPATLAKEPDDEKQLVGRFKQEIQDIANYSGAKRTDIAAGWKQSQLYHTYIEMGNESIQQGKPISDVMAFRKTSGKPYLSENQFHAISEVSRLLLR